LILSLELKRDAVEKTKEGNSIKRKREFYINVKSLGQMENNISCLLMFYLTSAGRKKRLHDETDASSNSSSKKIKSLMSREPRGAAVKFEGEFLPTYLRMCHFYVAGIRSSQSHCMVLYLKRTIARIRPVIRHCHLNRRLKVNHWMIPLVPTKSHLHLGNANQSMLS
jgi:hypothetical protein